MSIVCIYAVFCFSMIRTAAFRFQTQGLLGRRVTSLHTRNIVQLRSPQTHRHSKQGSEKEFAQGKNVYLTTPIYYVNGTPHIGHAYTSVMTDILARFFRSDGKKVLFLSGTDEHGQKVEQSASKAKKSPLEFANKVSAAFRDMTRELNCSNDDFIRTTEFRHYEAVQHFWKLLEAKGLIYLGHYEGWYSVRDEAFYQESDLVNGKAPTGADVTWVKEESYFFRLSQFTDRLKQFFESHPDWAMPASRRNELYSFLNREGGLKDLSISRTTFSWGIPVPNNPKHVVYVWMDALVNYLTALGYPDVNSQKMQDFWPADAHIVGKDILRFHAIYWPAFLMAADLPLPKRLFAHGWWTKDGQKMSKSVGNVVNPHKLVLLYGVDPVRYFLATEMPFGNDGDFSHTALVSRSNSDLANDLGNLEMRVLVCLQKYRGSEVPVLPPADQLQPSDVAVLDEVYNTLPLLREQILECNLRTVSELGVNLAKLGNRYITSEAPWELAKRLETDPAAKQRVEVLLAVLCELLRCTGIYLQPVIPGKMQEMLDRLAVPTNARDFASIDARVGYGPGCRIGERFAPLFPKLQVLADEAVVTSTPALPEDLRNSIYNLEGKETVAARIRSVGEAIRSHKARGKVSGELGPLISELLCLKDRYKVLNNGVAYA